ncbi:MAG: TolC family outer membrane protein [Qingshengfaniella sp.]
MKHRVPMGHAFYSVVLAAGLAAMPATSETLTDALVSAYNNSSLLEQSRAVLRASDEDVASAVALLRPTLDYSASRTWGWSDRDQPTSDNDTVTNTLGLTSQLSLYEFGRNRLAIEAAKEAVLAARQSLRNQEQQVLLSAVEAYMELRRAMEFVDLRQNNVRVLSEEMRAANDRFEVGEVTRTDVAQAEARLADAEANLISAQGDLDVAREAFKLAVGRYPENPAPPPALPRTAANEAAARDVAVREHPQILQAQRLVSVAEINIERAQAAVLPSLSANASVGWSDQNAGNKTLEFEPSASVGVELRGPIYRGGALNSAYRSATAQRDLNRAQLLRTTDQVANNVAQAWTIQEVDRAILVSTERQINASRVAFEGTREEATLGARTTLDVLNAEQELLDAQAARISAAARLQVAAYAVLSSMGRLTVDYLQLPVTAYDPSVYYNAVRNAPAVNDASGRGLQLDRVLKSIGKY